MKKCQNCGYENQNTSNFCIICGISLENVSPNEPEADMKQDDDTFQQVNNNMDFQPNENNVKYVGKNIIQCPTCNFCHTDDTEVCWNCNTILKGSNNIITNNTGYVNGTIDEKVNTQKEAVQTDFNSQNKAKEVNYNQMPNQQYNPTQKQQYNPMQNPMPPQQQNNQYDSNQNYYNPPNDIIKEKNEHEIKQEDNDEINSGNNNESNSEDDNQNNNQSIQSNEVEKDADDNDDKTLKKDKIRNDYLKSLGKSADNRSNDYDPTLVKVSDDGDVTDYNNIKELLKDAVKYNAITIASTSLMLVLIMGLLQGQSHGQLRAVIIIIMSALFSLAGIISLFVRFIESVKSSRDITYKLITSIYVLPLLCIICIFNINFGLMQNLIIVIVVITLIFLLLCGLSD